MTVGPGFLFLHVEEVIFLGEKHLLVVVSLLRVLLAKEVEVGLADRFFRIVLEAELLCERVAHEDETTLLVLEIDVVGQVFHHRADEILFPGAVGAALAKGRTHFVEGVGELAELVLVSGREILDEVALSEFAGRLVEL